MHLVRNLSLSRLSLGAMLWGSLGCLGLDWTGHVTLMLSLLRFENPAAPCCQGAAFHLSGYCHHPNGHPPTLFLVFLSSRWAGPGVRPAIRFSPCCPAGGLPGVLVTLSAADPACAADGPGLWGAGDGAGGVDGGARVVVHASGIWLMRPWLGKRVEA